MDSMIEDTLNMLGSTSDAVATEATKNEDKLFGVFTKEQLAKMHDDYKTHWNAEQSLQEIATPLLRHYHLRSLDELRADDMDDMKKMNAIKTAFYACQEVVVTKMTKKRQTIEHKRGDFKRDNKGQLIMKEDKSGYEFYSKNEKETVEIEVETPFFDYKNSQQGLFEIKKFVENIVVSPDFDDMKKRLCSKIDFERGLDIIRELTKYYVFEDNEKFVERFAMMICNAKAKGLNIHPKYPVLFSLVGEQGKGKGWMANMIQKTYDRQFETTSSQTSFKKLLNGTFNGVMMTRGFIHFDEKNGLDATQAEELKNLITEPYVSVNMKYKEDRPMRNLVTFFSTTNESIKDVMGLQKDRRLVEFVLKEKTKEIPTEKMEALLNELWEVMPVQFPNPDKVVEELLEESGEVLDNNMNEIVYDLFENHRGEFVQGKFVSVRKMKTVLQNMKGNRSQFVVDWCEKKGVIARYANGSYYIDNTVLTKILNEQKQVCSFGPKEIHNNEEPDIFVEGL